MMEDPDFDGKLFSFYSKCLKVFLGGPGKPLVMLIGQYSTGKTTFIRLYIYFMSLLELLFVKKSAKIIHYI